MSSINNMVNRHRTEDVTPYFEIEKIEACFNSKVLPKTIKLDKVTTINDVETMVKCHIEYLRQHATKPIYKPYFDRLTKLAKLL